jgi:hypothetical protein
VEWTDTPLYIDLLGRTADRAGLSVTCDTSSDGAMIMVTGVPKTFEAFVMMCVSRLFRV